MKGASASAAVMMPSAAVRIAQRKSIRRKSRGVGLFIAATCVTGPGDEADKKRKNHAPKKNSNNDWANAVHGQCAKSVE